jgi:hypothetical protein
MLGPVVDPSFIVCTVNGTWLNLGQKLILVVSLVPILLVIVKFLELSIGYDLVVIVIIGYNLAQTNFQSIPSWVYQ